MIWWRGKRKQHRALRALTGAEVCPLRILSTQYDKEQAKQYDRIQKLEEEVNHLDQMTLRLDRIERKIEDGKPRE